MANINSNKNYNNFYDNNSPPLICVLCNSSIITRSRYRKNVCINCFNNLYINRPVNDIDNDIDNDIENIIYNTTLLSIDNDCQIDNDLNPPSCKKRKK